MFIDLNSSPVKISLVPSSASFQLLFGLANSVNSSGDETAGDELVLARLEAGDPNVFDYCNGEKIGCFFNMATELGDVPPAIDQLWACLKMGNVSIHGHFNPWWTIILDELGLPCLTWNDANS